MAILRFDRDKDLLNRIKSNDRTVLGELFVRHRQMVAGHVLQNGGDDSDAEDMLQEAIIVLWQNVCSGHFELKARISTYLMSVVVNKWKTELRRRRRISDSELLADLRDDGVSALDDFIKNEERDAVNRALQSLTESCRQLLLLFYFEERNFKDIARIMGFAGPDVAKAKKYQCKKSLEAALHKASAKSRRHV